jgi:hypothetical protein
MKSYKELMSELEIKINSICTADKFNNVAYYDAMNQYKVLQAYDIALSPFYCHNRLTIENRLRNAI